MAGLPPDVEQRLRDLQARMDTMAADAKRVVIAVDAEILKYSPARIASAMVAAVPDVRGAVVRAISENYRKSGLGTHGAKRVKFAHGWLERMIRGIAVRLEIQQSKSAGGFVPRLRVSLGEGSVAQIVAAASLNYGAVHAPKVVRPVIDTVTGKMTAASGSPTSILGEKAKRTLKKYALTGKISRRARMAIQRDAEYMGRLSRKGVAVKDRSASGRSINVANGVNVRTPWPFFYYSTRQLVYISAVFNESVLRHLNGGSAAA